MGMIKCSVHGLTHITTCCEHIGDAVDADRFERAHAVVDGWGVPAILCDRCRELVIALTESTTTKWNIHDLQLGAPLQPYCHRCLMAWYAGTGQGDMSEAIARARDQGPA